MSGEIGVAVIGFGLAGRVFHAPFVSAVPGLRLEAIVQRKGDEAAAAWPNARILRSVDEALGDATVQLIVVGTPNETHFELAKQALLAGKNVVVDKPFATTSAEAAELKELAEKMGLVLAPFHNRRWDGDFLTVRKLLEEEAVGRLVTYESHFDRFRPLPRENTWKEGANAANGLLMDLGPHLVDQALTLFGVPEGITASVRKDRDSTAIEDAFDITLEYPRLRAHCRSSMLACDAAPRFLLHGTRGSFKKWGLDPQEPALVGGARVPRMREGETVKKSDISPGYVTELLPLRPSDIIMEGDIEKGYRTFGEVNNLLPGDITTAPDLDDLLTRINTQGIAFLSGESELTGERQKYEPEWLAEPESQWGTLTVAPVLADPGTLTRTRVKTELGDYRRYYANVRDAINGVAKLAVTPEDGYRVIRLLEMARESSAAGKTLKVEF